MPFLIILSSPSGCGKTTLCNMLLKNNDNIKQSISATTRSPRPGEIDEKHYHFLTIKEFEEKIKNNDFLEYAKVFDNYYGTLKKSVQEILDNGKNAILVIDYQGAQLVSKQWDSEKLLKIFILPPSLEELRKRLINRKQDSKEVIEKRIKKAKFEMTFASEYDASIVNDDLNKAYNELVAAITNFKKSL